MIDDSIWRGAMTVGGETGNALAKAMRLMPGRILDCWDVIEELYAKEKSTGVRRWRDWDQRLGFQESLLEDVSRADIVGSGIA